ncbi:MAG TPA: DUF3617 family protein [Thiobacillus sp.]|jgi:hypothetical protein|nr:MAG: hypothetical protein B7Y27_06925 [Hydrogenophilales bacterium 16-64-40]OZA34960.1 MAG: hypothetical protein B7X82_03020 [Hydrogenophilales bacterium 17-64-65]HQS80933.1 DUF3617 family protein [Thiobacillus sp.]HQT33451.1 DUF3617 family protein [Thiobacillus sp.]
MRPLLTAALLVLTALPAAAAPTLQPGLYDISAQVVMKGMQMPVMTFRQCLTDQDIADGKAYAATENKDCMISKLSESGNQVSYDFNCALRGSQRMAGRASGTTHANGYDVLMSGRFVPPMQGMGEFSQKLSAKRLGACQ